MESCEFVKLDDGYLLNVERWQRGVSGLLMSVMPCVLHVLQFSSAGYSSIYFFSCMNFSFNTGFSIFEDEEGEKV